MKQCKLTILNEVFSQFSGLDKATTNKCVNKLKYLVPWRFHTPSFKLGRWDGAVRLFQDNGRVYSNLIPDIIDIIVNEGYDIDMVDNRTFGSIKVPKIGTDIFSSHKWPKGHKNEGEPIMLREDQCEAANIFSDYRYAIQELSTGYGKCLDYKTLIPIFCESELIATDLDITANIKQDIEIGKLVEYFNKHEDLYTPTNIEGNGIYAYTHEGNKTLIRHVIRKFEPCLQFFFEDDTNIICADKHIFRLKGNSISALDVASNGKKSIDANIFERCKRIKTIKSIDKRMVYDISIDAPHWYVDSNNIIHHNTILTAAICKQVEHLGRTLTIVPNKSLVRQTHKSMELVGMDASVYFSEEKDVSSKHVITTWQSLERLDKDKNKSPVARQIIDDMKKNLIQIIVDECHGAKSAVLDKLLSNEFANVPLRRGFTGTMPPEEHFTKTVIGNIGEIVHKVAARDLQEQGYLAECFVHGMVFDDNKSFNNYHDEYTFLTENYNRLSGMVDTIKEISKSGNTLVLVDRITTGEHLSELIDDSYFVHGTTSLKQREKIYELASNNNGLTIFATYGVAAVGIDIPRLYNVVLFEPGKSFIRIIQSIGRGLRLAKDKKYADIWDFSSTNKFSKKHFKERKKYYAKADYPYNEFIGTNNDLLIYIKEQIENVQREQQQQ